MNKSEHSIPIENIDDLYEEIREWHVNVGDEKVYPKRMKGRWRNLKWWTASVWLVFFLGPYIRWGDRQAVLWDLPNQLFHFFAFTILPQDLWLLAFVLLFFAILLAVTTAVAGRVFCGYFCFQTVWTDIYMLIETWLEGPPLAQQKLDAAPWSLHKTAIKVIKHCVWLSIGLLTGVSFVAWFMDAFSLWQGLLSLQLPIAAWVTLGAFTCGTYTLAGFMREQTCLWLCPYARIQGVMIDENTVVPAYDAARGEPRSYLRKGQDPEPAGDCINCNQCVVVCPTGIDIRHGQQQGCITCGLCIDACDSVMEKIGRAKGLVRYDSLSGLTGELKAPWFKRLRVWVYLSIMCVSVSAVLYGFSTLENIELKVINERQPLFVKMTDGSIQNGYQLKILNKTDTEKALTVRLLSPNYAELRVGPDTLTARASGVTGVDAFIRIPSHKVQGESTKVIFEVISKEDKTLTATRESVFFAPAGYH